MIIRHVDIRGAIANVTGILAKQGLNIANMQGYRREAGGDAMIVLELDGVPDEATIEQIRQLPCVQGVTFMRRRSEV